MTSTEPVASRERLHELLQQFTGFTSFRPDQLETIENTLAGNDTLLLKSTGGGKSLTFILSALASGRSMLVVSPFISLMQDQSMNLTTAGVTAVALNSENKDPTAESQAIAGAFNIIFLAPERLVNWLDHIETMLRNKVLWGIAVDESHSISEAGFGFRPDYRQLGLIRARFPMIPILAVTATATRVVEKDIIDQLGLRHPLVLRSSFNRPNLMYRMSMQKTKSPLTDLTDDLFGGRDTDQLSLVYCFSRKETEDLAAHFCLRGYRAAAYHAKMEPEQKKKVHKDFVNGRINIVTATTSFGTGIDIPCVRLVVNWGIPKSIEEYMQQTGRAGRDGLPSECMLFATFGDLKKTESMVSNDGKPNAIDMFKTMTNLIKSKTCRRKTMLAYFDEDTSTLPNMDRERCCDNCAGTTARGHTNSSSSTSSTTESKPKAAKAVKQTSEFILDSTEKELLGDIRQWVKTQASETGLAHYMILNDRSMHELALRRPIDKNHLAAIHGVAQAKITRFGNSLLAMIQATCTRLGISTNTGASITTGGGSGLVTGAEGDSKSIPGSCKPQKRKLGAAAEETWKRLTGEGLTVDQIAEARGVKVNTVLDHLVQCLETHDVSDVNWSKVTIDTKVIRKVDKFMREYHQESSKWPTVYELKEGCGLPIHFTNAIKLARLRFLAQADAQSVPVTEAGVKRRHGADSVSVVVTPVIPTLSRCHSSARATVPDTTVRPLTAFFSPVQATSLSNLSES